MGFPDKYKMADEMRFVFEVKRLFISVLFSKWSATFEDELFFRDPNYVSSIIFFTDKMCLWRSPTTNFVFISALSIWSSTTLFVSWFSTLTRLTATVYYNKFIKDGTINGRLANICHRQWRQQIIDFVFGAINLYKQLHVIAYYT